VSTNAKILSGAKSPSESFALLQAMTALPEHVLMPDDIDLSRYEHFFHGRLYGYRQVTDAHLLAIALRHGAALATFDCGIAQLVPANWQHSLIAIPV
jgi:uncharacterized protein